MKKKMKFTPLPPDHLERQLKRLAMAIPKSEWAGFERRKFVDAKRVLHELLREQKTLTMWEKNMAFYLNIDPDVNPKSPFKPVQYKNGKWVEQ